MCVLRSGSGERTGLLKLPDVPEPPAVFGSLPTGGEGLRLLSEAAVAALYERGLTVASAESLTAGMVAAALADVPGASRTLRGAMVVYATETKASVLGVDPEVLARFGPVSAQVAAAMAEAVAARFGSDCALATTGVAGPDELDGHPVGTVFTAIKTPTELQVRRWSLIGDRTQIREQTVTVILNDLVDALRQM